MGQQSHRDLGVDSESDSAAAGAAADLLAETGPLESSVLAMGAGVPAGTTV
jgi:hypothetical protein